MPIQMPWVVVVPLRSSTIVWQTSKLSVFPVCSTASSDDKETYTQGCDDDASIEGDHEGDDAENNHNTQCMTVRLPVDGLTKRFINHWNLPVILLVSFSVEESHDEPVTK